PALSDLAFGGAAENARAASRQPVEMVNRMEPSLESKRGRAAARPISTSLYGLPCQNLDHKFLSARFHPRITIDFRPRTAVCYQQTSVHVGSPPVARPSGPCCLLNSDQSRISRCIELLDSQLARSLPPRRWLLPRLPTP